MNSMSIEPRRFGRIQTKWGHIGFASSSRATSHWRDCNRQ